MFLTAPRQPSAGRLNHWKGMSSDTDKVTVKYFDEIQLANNTVVKLTTLDGGVKKVLFRAEEAERFDENTNRTTKYWTYSAVVEKDGFEWTFPLTTRRPSDRAILENYIRYLRFVAEREAAAAQTNAKA